MCQQHALALQAPCVAGERVVGADDTMAGDDDGDRIAGVGHAHRARGLRPADAARQFGVRNGLAYAVGGGGPSWHSAQAMGPFSLFLHSVKYRREAEELFQET